MKSRTWTEMNAPTNPSESVKRRNPHLFPRTEAHIQALSVSCRAPKSVEREADLHDQIEEWVRSQGWYYLHSRLDRRTTNQVGAPDWVLFVPNRVICIECKRSGAKQTPKQLAAQAQLRKLGHMCEVVHNMDEFLNVVVYGHSNPPPATPAL